MGGIINSLKFHYQDARAFCTHLSTKKDITAPFKETTLNIKLKIPNSLLSIIDQGLVSVANFGIAFALARNLSVRSFGLYILLFSIWTFINSIQSGYIHQGLYVLTHSEGDIYYKNMYFVQIIFSVINLFFMLLCSFSYNFFDPQISLKLLCLFSFAVFFLTLKEYARNNALAKIKIWTAIGYDLLFIAITIGLIIFFHLTNITSIYNAWMSIGVGASIITILDLFISQNDVIFKLNDVISIFKINFKLTKWTTLSQILVWININIYKFIVTGFLGLEILAGIGAAQYIIQILNPIRNGLHIYGITILSKIKNNNNTIYLKKFKQYSYFLITITILILIPIFYFPVFFLELFYDDKFASYGRVLQIFVFAAFLATISRILIMDLMIKKMVRLIFDINILSVSINVILLYALISLMGYTGVLIFLAIQYFVSLFITGHAYSTHKKQQSYD